MVINFFTEILLLYFKNFVYSQGFIWDCGCCYMEFGVIKTRHVGITFDFCSSECFHISFNTVHMQLLLNAWKWNTNFCFLPKIRNEMG